MAVQNERRETVGGEDRARPQMSPDVSRCPQMSTAHLVGKTNPPDERLTPRQRAAARAIAQGASVGEVATRLRVSRRTLARWQQLAAFREELLRLHRRAAKRAGDNAPLSGSAAQRAHAARLRPAMPISRRYPDLIPPGSVVDRVLNEIEANRLRR